jgi:hypothetical protein
MKPRVLLKNIKSLYEYSMINHCLLLLCFSSFIPAAVQANPGLVKNMVSDTSQPGAFPLVASEQAAPLCYDSND